MLKQQIQMARQRRQDGFTLIELLIVIIVLGILAGIVVFGVATFRGDAALAACRADLKTVQTASDAYFARNQPSHATAIDDEGHSATTLVGGGYLKAAPATSSALTLHADGSVSSTVAGCTN